MKNKYSKIYRSKQGPGKEFGFRYNYEDSVLEYVTNLDMIDDPKHPGEYIMIHKKEWEVIDSTGLSVDSWKNNPVDWIEQFQDEIREELFWLSHDLDSHRADEEG